MWEKELHWAKVDKICYCTCLISAKNFYKGDAAMEISQLLEILMGMVVIPFLVFFSFTSWKWSVFIDLILRISNFCTISSRIFSVHITQIWLKSMQNLLFAVHGSRAKVAIRLGELTYLHPFECFGILSL